MNEAMFMIITWITGIALSLFFYGGLWITVRYISSTKHPLPLTLISFLVRMIGTASVFIIIARSGKIEHLAVTLLGFIIGRYSIVRHIYKINEGKEMIVK